MMADEIDIEALLEAPFKKTEEDYSNVKQQKSFRKDDRDEHYHRESDRNDNRRHPRSRSRSKGRQDSRHDYVSSGKTHYSYRRSRSRSLKRDHTTTAHLNSESKTPSREHHRRSRSPSYPSSRSKPSHHDYYRSESSSLHNQRQTTSPSLKDKVAILTHRSPSRSPQRISASLLSEAQRDRRTVFCRQLAQRLESRQLKEFCEQVGKVRDVRIVYDKISRRSKGVAYVEFMDEESVPLAVAMTGKKLLSIPIIVELTETEKNRIAEEAAAALRMEKLNQRPIITQLFISNLHPSIGEGELLRMFKPFGEIIEAKVNGEEATGTVQFRVADDAQQASDKMDGFELAGRSIRVSVRNVEAPPPSDIVSFDNTTSQNPTFEEEAMDVTESLLKCARDASTLKKAANSRPSPCVLLQYMYDPAGETEVNWEFEIAEEVRDECVKFGRVEHVHVPKTVDGDVFIRFASVDSAQAACTSLAGRWFGGKQLVATFIPLDDYLQRYPS